MDAQQATCAIPGCTDRKAKRDLCNKHYLRQYRYGSTDVVHSTARPTTPDYVAKRFWPRVNKKGPIPAHRPELGPCWTWTGGRDEDGYGRFMRATKRILAHRFSWELANGSIPEGFLVCHHCDNPPCVNPSHLFLGTHKDNGRDREAKGRTKGTWWRAK